MAQEKKILSTFRFRRDTTENWLANKDTIPMSGEPCYDIDLKTLRIGDGKTTYENLPIIGNSEGGDVGALQAEINAMKGLIDAMQESIADMEDQVGETNVVEVHENVTILNTQMESTQAEIETVQQTLENKADAETVVELEENLKIYVDEQIKTTDYGEI